jgi:ADP-heptose:LPS heptosyltransferase
MSFSPTPGKLYFSEDEINKAKVILNSAKDYWKKNNNSKFKAIIFFESSSTKIDDNFYYNKMKNKDWGESNWKKLILRLKSDYLIVQSKHEKSKRYDGAYYPSVDFDFRIACAIINECDLFLGPEGGFGHAAAALEKKAVLYFGGWIHPKVTGYKFHENIYFNHPKSPCGTVGYICAHCEEARKSISVNDVYGKIISILSC